MFEIISCTWPYTIRIIANTIINITASISTDKTTYQRGENIYFTGSVEDFNSNSISSGTATITLSSDDWSTSFETTISNGRYSTSYQIDSNDPRGSWTTHISIVDSKGNFGSTYDTRTLTIESIFDKLTIDTPDDDDLFEVGQLIEITGTAKAPNGNNVRSGTVVITLSSNDWEHNITANIVEGSYETSYYIPFDKPTGIWTISANATDNYGNIGNSWKTSLSNSEDNAVIKVINPESYDNYIINIVNPTIGKTMKRGETITISAEITNVLNEKIQNADVIASFSTGQKIER